MPAFLLPLFSSLGSLLLKFGGYILLGGVIIAGYFYWQHEERDIATLQKNLTQYEQTVKDNNAQIAALKQIQTDISDSLNDEKQKNQSLISSLANVTTYVNSAQAVTDSRASSVVLKNTVEQLQGTLSPPTKAVKKAVKFGRKK